MKKLLLFIAAGTLTINALLTQGCGSCSKGSDTIDTPVIDTPVIDTPETLIVKQPHNAVFLMDASWSMKGYLDSKDEKFRGVVAKYLYLSQKEPQVLLYGTKNNKENTQTRDSFIKSLNDNSVSWGDESDIKQMLEKMKNNSNDSTTAILVTDGILSGSTSDINKNREYNIQNASMMSTQLVNIFKGSGKSAIVVRYQAPFKGKYWCYNNNSATLDMKNRPYYIIAVGSWSNIKHIEQKLQDNKDLGECNHEEYAMFGDSQSHNYAKFSYGNGLKYDASTKKMTILDRDGEAVLTANLSALAPYMRTQDYWDNNLKVFIKYNNGIEKPMEKDKWTIEIGKNGAGEEIATFTALKAFNLSDSELRIELGYSQPKWVEDYSDSNDIDIATNATKLNKTFNFKYLAKGLAALQNSNNVINQTIKFNR